MSLIIASVLSSVVSIPLENNMKQAEPYFVPETLERKDNLYSNFNVITGYRIWGGTMVSFLSTGVLHVVLLL